MTGRSSTLRYIVLTVCAFTILVLALVIFNRHLLNLSFDYDNEQQKIVVDYGHKEVIVNDELNENIRLWHKNEIRNYNFVINKMTMGTNNIAPMLIQVRNDQLLSKQLFAMRGPMDVIDDFDEFETVEKVFAAIQDAYNKKLPLSVEYNKTFGYSQMFKVNTEPNKYHHTTVIELANFEIVEN